MKSRDYFMLVAVDPGLTGAITTYDTYRGRMDILDMPVIEAEISAKKTRKVLNEPEVFALFQGLAAIGFTDCFVEKVGGMPGQSAPAAFTFGYGVGVIHTAAMATGMSLHTIPPATWKAALRAPKDKKASCRRAIELIPTHRDFFTKGKTQETRSGRAESAMLAVYGERWLRGERGELPTPRPRKHSRNVWINPLPKDELI